MACDVPGRDRDLVRLIDAYVAIAQGGGGGQTVFVAGDEGSGRTALLRALATELERINPQPVVLAGAFRDGRFVAWSEEDVPVATAVDVVKNVVELAEALIPYAALVGQVLSKSQAAVELVRRLIGESERLGPTQFLPQLLRELCMRGPVVCLIDDADRAPAGLWGDLVLGLAGRIAADLRLLLVLAIDGPPQLGAGAMQLGEHNDDEPETLYVARKLTGRGIASWHPLARVTREELERWTGPGASGLLQRLLDVTGGRGAWAAQLWNHWQANDVVIHSQRGSPYWQFAADGHQRALDPVDDVLGRRLRHLVGNDVRSLDRARELLVCAALEGRRFTADAVAGALGRDQHEVAGLIDSKLAFDDQQQNRLVLQAGSVSIDDTGKRHMSLYCFQAELAWLTLGRYHGLSDDERRRLAAKLATALSTLYGRQAHRVAGVLARLFEIAGDADAAHHFQRMADAGVNRAIIVWRARQVLVAPEPTERADRRRASQILLTAADALGSGPSPEGLRFAETAQRLAPLDRDHARALYLMGVHHWRLGNHEQARNELTRVLGLYDFLADRRGEASARLALATINTEYAADDEEPPPAEPGAYRGAQQTRDCAQPSDSTLLEQARAGDTDAFATVYDRHAAAAYGLARRMLHSQDAAQDVVQEAFLILWRTDAYRSEKGSLRNFVLTITRNRAIDVQRKDRPRSAQERSDDTAAWILSAADHNQVAPAQRDSQQHLRAALSKLPDAQHRALELAVFDGLTHTEIALRLNEPIGTIKARLRLGLEKLRAELDATSCT